jgi:hypothetical protein
MRYFLLSPEVAAMGLGKNTQLDRSVHPPIITHLHYDFDVWLGDDLLECFPCFVSTRRLANAISEARLTGLEFGPVEITTSGLFRDLYPDSNLPEFLWLKVQGKSGKDDFGLDKDGRLVVSEHALHILKNKNLEHCDVSEIDQVISDESVSSSIEKP